MDTRKLFHLKAIEINLKRLNMYARVSNNYYDKKTHQHNSSFTQVDFTAISSAQINNFIRAAN